MIILLTLITISLGNIWILLGENWCWSLLGLKAMHNWHVYSNTGSLPFMYCLILAGGPFCIMGGRVTAPAVSSWFNWYLVLWRTFTTSRVRGSPLKELLTGVRAATTSDFVRFTFCLLSRTLCSRSAICFLSGWSSFCIRWMCSSEIQSGLEQFLQ